MVGGGLLAREMYRERAADSPTGPEWTAVTTPPPSPAEPPPGDPTVQLSDDAEAHPESQPVRSLLQGYFDAINLGSYERWQPTVTTDRVRAKSRSEWEDEYKSTKDGSITVYRIEAATGKTLQVLVEFTSTQDLAHAPPDMQETCIRWQLALPVVRENGQWKVDTVPSGTIPEHAKCEA